MADNIQNSTVIVDAAQGPRGAERRYIVEKHTDTVGGFHRVSYFGAKDVNADGLANLRAATQGDNLSLEEIRWEVDRLIGVDPAAPAVIKRPPDFATQDEMNEAVGDAYLESRTTELLNYAAALNDLPDQELIDALRLADPGQVTSVRIQLTGLEQQRNDLAEANTGLSIDANGKTHMNGETKGPT